MYWFGGKNGCWYAIQVAFTTDVDLNVTLNCAHKQLPSQCGFTMVFSEKLESYHLKAITSGIWSFCSNLWVTAALLCTPAEISLLP